MSDSTTTIADLQKLTQAFREERGWSNTLDFKDYPLSLVLEAAEVLELFQWIKGEEVEHEQKLHAAIGEELSDVLYWVLAMADRIGIDISEAFIAKLEKQAGKYPVEQFGQDVALEKRKQAYYRMKAKTRGGHPLAEEDGNDS